jgi:hypothetical protein
MHRSLMRAAAVLPCFHSSVDHLWAVAVEIRMGAVCPRARKRERPNSALASTEWASFERGHA